MSLYGNIKKVDSAPFQFDRKYLNRVAMDAAANTDGVYIGRYVLIEYGERFNGPVAGDSVEYTGQPNSYVITETGVPVTENQDFLNNKNIDLEAYGAVYDSTVWQKIYLEGTEKYIMVAELNATVPKIDMKLEKPVTYLNIGTDEEEQELYVGKRNSNGEYELYKLKGAKEEYTKPSFDTALDTELSYLMHQPTALSFKVNNDFIDFNKDGFNKAYSFGEKKGTNAVAWIPDPEHFNYTKEDPDSIDTTAKLEGVQNGQQIDTKVLLMSIPAIGNTLNTLYDLLYGTPQGDLTDGALRPYFELFRPNDEFLVPVITKDGEEVTINGVTKKVKGYPGTTVPVLLDEDDIEHLEDISPESVTGKHMDNQGNFGNIENDNLTNNFLVYANTNEQVMVTIPATVTGRMDTELAWLKNVPGIGEILANNTEGLVGILRKIFGYSDPITGQTRFYLYSDWAAETNLDSNTPAIINKPEVVGGYPVLFENKTEELENLSDDENAPATLVYNYIDTTIETYYSGGHHDVDFSTWQLTAAPLNQLIISVEKLPVSQVPHDGNQSDCEFNQSKVTVYQEGDLVIISGPFAQLKTFASTNPSYGSHKWLALDLMTNTTNITELKWGEYQLTQDDINESASVGLAENHIIFWIKADALKDNNMLDTPISVQISKGSSVRTLIFKFKNIGA